jgi:outer membrane receptor protein involved in Fe transport
VTQEPGLLRLFVVSVLSASIAQLASGVTRAAESAGSDAAAASNDAILLEEIVVTARLREESLQVVPISAQVVSGERLGELNLNSLGDLSEGVPSLHVEPVGRSTDIYIRGIGSGNNASFDQSVGAFVDDIYHGRSRTSAATFLDLDRVEILKGPQSTFFGDNAIAGALNIVTRKPSTDEANGFVRALYGQYGQYAVEGAANAPLTETFAVRVAATADGMTGWIKNVNDGSHSPDEGNKAGRITLFYAPTHDLDMTLKVEGGKNNESGGLVQQMVSCPPAAPFTVGGFCKTALGLGLPMGTDNHLTAFPPTQGSELSTVESVLTTNYRIGNHTLTSVSGYYYYDYGLHVDGDGTPLALITANVPEHFHQFSQELRIASPLGQTFEYLGGLYFHDDRLSAQQDTNYFFLTPNLRSAHFAALGPYLPLGQEIRYTQPERTYSVFGSATWNANDRLKFTTGLRASKVDKDINWNLFYGTASQTYGGVVALPANLQTLAAGAGLGTPGTLSDSRSDHALMPSAQVQYILSSAAMGYLSYARGFKAGGFNGVDTTGVVGNLPYNPEAVDAYEGGFKTTWLDGKLLANLAAFLSNYKDLQVTANTYSPTGAVISLVKNAASSRSEGVEFESQWRVTRNLRLGVEATYLDAHYVRYTNAGPTQLQQLEGIRIQDLSGQPTALAPRWSENVSGAYTVPLGVNYKLTTELIGYFSSRYFLSGSGTDDPLLSQGAYGRLDARIAFESADGRWGLEVLGKNLTDRTILVSGSAVPTTLGSAIVHAEMARSVAVQGSYKW